jgi:hypothetical protein
MSNIADTGEIEMNTPCCASINKKNEGTAEKKAYDTVFDVKERHAWIIKIASYASGRDTDSMSLQV